MGQKTIKPRAETLADKPSFRGLLERRRCLVLTDGFYEWRTMRREKRPMRYSIIGGEHFAFAGLWDV